MLATDSARSPELLIAPATAQCRMSPICDRDYPYFLPWNPRKSDKSFDYSNQDNGKLRKFLSFSWRNTNLVLHLQKRLVNVHQHAHQTFHQCHQTALGDRIMLLQQHLGLNVRSTPTALWKVSGRHLKKQLAKFSHERGNMANGTQRELTPKLKTRSPAVPKGSPRDHR